MHEKDHETAIRHYTRVRSEYHINNALVNYNLGVAYLKSNRLSEALQMFQQATILKPDYPAAIFNTAYIQYRQENISEAIQTFSQAIKAKPAPEYAPELQRIGIELSKSGRPNESIQFFLLAIQADPASDSSYFNLGIILQRVGRVEAALRAYRKTLAINSDHTRAANNLKELLQTQH